MAQTSATVERVAPEARTTFPVLFAISFCHTLNDMMQSLLPAIYPLLKATERFHLSVQNAQIHLFVFLGAVAAGTLIGGVAEAAGDVDAVPGRPLYHPSL